MSVEWLSSIEIIFAAFIYQLKTNEGLEYLKPKAEASWKFISTKADEAAVATAESVQQITSKLAVVINEVGKSNQQSSNESTVHAEAMTIWSIL